MIMIMVAAGCKPAQQTPVIVTVVQTIPVEVTRLVEMTVPVEVTREVFVTQIVEVQVTPTSAVSGTPTTQASNAQPLRLAGSQFLAAYPRPLASPPKQKGKDSRRFSYRVLPKSV
jgi:hypothetical protein